MGVASDRPYDVLFPIPWAGPLLEGSNATGGAETQIVTLARGLAARGLKVGILVIGERSRLPPEIDGVDVIAQRRPPNRRGIAGLVHDADTLWALLRTPARVIVQRNASRAVAIAALAGRLRGARFIYSSASVLDFDLRRVDRPWNVRLYERAVKAADEVVVQTDEQADLCRRRFGRDPVVIRSIAERAEPRQIPGEAFLWVARTAPYKRLDVYLGLAAAVPEARFLVIATPVPGEDAALRSRLERAGRELPNLEVLEPRPRAELGPHIERAVAMVNTSDYEGMPNVLLEGWTRGVPALAFSHDPDGIVAEHGLGAFAAGSHERLVEHARSLWASRSDQRELSERCIAYVHRHHDLEAVCAAWSAVIAADAALR
jgi:glycosyltransferase involved in cell wall biosynthesis